LASYTLAFALQPRKKHGKTSVKTARNLGFVVLVMRKLEDNIKIILEEDETGGG